MKDLGANSNQLPNNFPCNSITILFNNYCIYFRIVKNVLHFYTKIMKLLVIFKSIYVPLLNILLQKFAVKIRVELEWNVILSDLLIKQLK